MNRIEWLHFCAGNFVNLLGEQKNEILSDIYILNNWHLHSNVANKLLFRRHLQIVRAWQLLRPVDVRFISRECLILNSILFIVLSSTPVILLRASLRTEGGA